MKKILSLMLAGAMVMSFASMAVSAAAPTHTANETAGIVVLDSGVVDGDGVTYTSKGVNIDIGADSIEMDTVTPNSTIYIKLPTGVLAADNEAIHTGSDFRDTKLYSFSAKKETNSKLVKSITFESQKSVNGVRADWIKVMLNDNTMTSEQKFEGSVTFKAKKTMTATDNMGYASTSDMIKVGDTAELNLTLWVNNKVVSDSADTGDRVVMNPTSNEENLFVWGDDKAALYFDANDNAGKFYARMSTKSDAEIYNTYADPVNADLWFYDFVGNPTVPATSRATLTLGLGWDDDDDYTVDPEDCFIYQKNADGELVDVTNQFTYSDDNDGTTGIAGWTIKTRTLGTYIISDVELDLDAVDSDESASSGSSSNGDKEIPSTGSGDMVNVAVVTAVVALTAAGAIAFKKASK